MKHIFGPVPSRRLGMSLGVDLVKPKTCTFDCIYCECGPTTNCRTKTAEYVRIDSVLKELEEALSEFESSLDFVTFSGSGEPLLNSRIDQVVQWLKKHTNIPIAVLTNGSLMIHAEVRRKIVNVDAVLPSLDAAVQKDFETINQPCDPFSIEDIISGLQEYRKSFHGKLLLEILFCRNVNDSPENIEALKKALDKIQPDEVQLNTVVRPGAYPAAEAVTPEFLEKIKNEFQFPTSIIASFESKRISPETHEKTAEKIISLLDRRPCTLTDVMNALGLKKQKAESILKALIQQRKIRTVNHEGRSFFHREQK